MSPFVQLILANPTSGIRQFDRWLIDVHAPEVLQNPAVSAVACFEFSDEQLGKTALDTWRYLMVVEFATKDAHTAAKNLRQRLRHQGPFAPFEGSDAIDQCSLACFSFGEITPRVPTQRAVFANPREKRLVVVLGNPLADRDLEYNSWYDDVHVHQVTACPGFTAVQRFRLADSDTGLAENPWQYLSLYEVESDDLRGTIDEFRSRSGADGKGNGWWIRSPALNRDTRVAITFRPFGARMAFPVCGITAPPRR